MNKDKKFVTKKGASILLAILAVSALLLFVFSYFLTSVFLSFLTENQNFGDIKETIAARGQIGDTFGSVNALFSCLAFVGVLFTIYLQREELQLTREELEGQRHEFEEQNETLRLQRFENTFFQMLSLRSEIISETSIVEGMGTYSQREIKGREILSCSLYPKYRNGINSEKKAGRAIDMSKLYDGLYRESQLLGICFRTLYEIVKLIDENEVHKNNADGKQRYVNLVRSQLSNYELLVLFYHCFFSEHGAKFKPYIFKYDLLDNLPWHDLIDETAHRLLYDQQKIEYERESSAA